jgi:thiol:disulfide interchange protein DsbD
MRKSVFIAIFLIVSFSAFSQILKPVKWSFSSKKISDNVAELIFTATLDKGWHLYSQYIPPKGPVPTSFKIKKSADFQTVGKITEPKPIEENDPNFDMVLKFFAKSAVFKQKINLISEKPFKVKGTLEFMCCNDVSCLPPEEIEFEIKVEGGKNISKTENIIKDTVDSTKTVTVVDTTITKSPDSSSKATVDNNEIYDFSKGNLLKLFLFALLAGLGAIITPCVFPMIPMTVSFFMHDGESKAKSKIKALIFGLSIILIYTVIGTIVSITLGVNFANWLSTHWFPNILFFLIFIVFAASFFGAFEITLPSWMINKSDKQADKGGLLGSFFMAFTLVLVSFSCTGPLVGAILVMSAGGQYLEPIIGMLGFSIAFALPFTLFAFFPQWLSKMPKSGGWLNSVKVVLGFIELALGLKFLSIADQTYHWRILDREVYLAFWIVIFTLMGFYLLGKIKFKHDSEVKHIGVFRLTLVIITFSFVIYLFPGMFGAPLKALSGYLPPMTTLDFDVNQIVRDNSGNKTEDLCETPKYDKIFDLPHGLNGYFDFEQGKICAKQQKKPIFIDFTGHGCVNCREMEANVWSNPEVLKRLRENFIIVTLYVDDKTSLPENEVTISTYDGKKLNTIGKKYSDWQISMFKVNSQPYYFLIDPFVDFNSSETVNNAKLTGPKAYDKTVGNFINFLDAGIAEFKKRHP